MRLCDDKLGKAEIMQSSKEGGDLCGWHQCNFLFHSFSSRNFQVVSGVPEFRSSHCLSSARLGNVGKRDILKMSFRLLGIISSAVTDRIA